MRTRAWAVSWTLARAAMAILTIAAIAAQLVKSVDTARELGRDVATTIANFFSFFTILSNTGTAVVLLWAVAWYLVRGRRVDVEPLGLAVALASVSTYMIITGIVYNTLLRTIVLPQGSEPIPWSNEVLHLIGPVFLLADVFVGPLRRALSWRSLWTILAFPIAWVIYTMLRGPLTTNPVSGDPFWYPYPFLDPNSPGGWPSVVVYVVGIAVAIVVVGGFVVWWGRRRGIASMDAEPSAVHVGDTSARR
ncbi:Pr6Pr family membrane protein [Microbacterium sp. B2969]|uniref:Pr6Pr family membrane protein n=1 Tax=Microbacterium alkaliflavum TaxID=3248839 RepID=A0ABW7QAQ4_9MICO